MHGGRGFRRTALRAAPQAALQTTLFVATATVAAADPQEAYSVTVRVYDRAGVDAVTTRTALATSEAALRSASVAVRWEECPVSSVTLRCDAPLAGADKGELLGYAIAHELGHLLLASHVHSGQRSGRRDTIPPPP